MISPSPSVIPRPCRIVQLSQKAQLSPETIILAPEELLSEATLLAARLSPSTGYHFPIRQECNSPAGLVISLSVSAAWSHLGAEGYSLKVSEKEIEIRSATSAGIYWGTQTFLQLLPPAIFSFSPRVHIEWVLPCLMIEDTPRFSWRGAMLDCGRYFMPVDFVKKFIDLMALHKLNRFHWHLTEDQGWRIEIKAFPKLTEVGAWRKETQTGHFFAEAGGDGVPCGGFYSQEDVAEIVRYAGERHIEIVPEIEMPGHSLAAIAAYPELGSDARVHEVATKWGIHEPGICNPSDATINFFKQVLTEVMVLFPGKYIHIGGDEAVKTCWENNPSIVRRMHEVGVANMEELQAWFIQQVQRFLVENGRSLVGWDEIMEGGLAEGATLMSWRGVQAGLTAVGKGHDVVMTPEMFTYFNFYQNEDISEEPLAIGGYISLEKAYNYEPVPAHLPPREACHILGLQGQLWSEYLRTPSEVEYMALPRLAALSEVAWSSLPNRDYPHFLIRLPKQLKRYDILNLRHGGMPKSEAGKTSIVEPAKPQSWAEGEERAVAGEPISEMYA